MLIIALVALVSAGLSALCSLMEAALYSVSPGKARALVDQGVRGSRFLVHLREHVDRPISAILTFNTIANTVGASIFGALAGREFGSESPVVLLMALLFTFVILVFSEIIPKTLGVTYAEFIAPKTAPIMMGLIWALYPFVGMSQYVTGRIRQAGAEYKIVTEADLEAQVRIGVEEGSLLPEEAIWVTNALRLNDKTAHELMTPRTVVLWVPAEQRLAEVDTRAGHWTHSRVPVCRENDPDQVAGLIYRREIFETLLNQPEEEIDHLTLADMAHPVEFIPETLTGNELLRRFLQGRQHLFIVTNEHGGMEGVITLEDVLEELLGSEIVDHHDVHVDMQEYARLVAEQRKRASAGEGVSKEDNREREPETPRPRGKKS